MAIMVRRFEHHDAALWRLVGVRVAAVLRDENAALLIERHGARRFHLGLGGDELDPQRRLDLERLEFLVRGVRRVVGNERGGAKEKRRDAKTQRRNHEISETYEKTMPPFGSFVLFVVYPLR